MHFSMSLGLCFALAAGGAEPPAAWHLAGWGQRAVVEIAEPLGTSGCDTAAARILSQGLAKEDGSDFRVLDAAGQPVPFQVMWHDATHTSLIAFRAAEVKPGQRYYIYYGNAQAVRAAEEVVLAPQPGAGPPAAAWIPHAGLVYSTLKRPEGDNPKTVEELTKLLAESPGKWGAQYQQRISDGYNPFGDSDNYLSTYRGWIRIPSAGKYQFCTASNEASFSFLDGKELIHWPGRHTAERGMKGEKNASVELTAGLHYIEYYHEEVVLQQVAFLGWRQPTDPENMFSGIPEEIFTRPHATAVSRAESAQGPGIRFEPQIADSIWPTTRHEGQYTHVRFAIDKSTPLPEGATCTWTFGDGQTVTDNTAEHVYLALGRYDVTLTVEAPAGKLTAAWPLEVYEVQHATTEILEGRPSDYLAIVKAYDRSKLNAASLRELTFLLSEMDDPATALQAGKEYVERFSGENPEVLPKLRRLMAECAIRLGESGLDQAIENYEASLSGELPAAEKFDIYTRLIRLVGIERDSPDKAGEILVQVEATAKKAAPDEKTKNAYREAILAAGDVLLWHGKRDGAHDLYKRAELLHGKFVPSQVRAARVGAYPDSIEEYIQDGNRGAAFEIVDRWEDTFPTEKVKGQTFYWRGKLLNLQGEDKNAARYLARAIGLATGAEFEAEARWLLANSLEKLGKTDAARKELAKLVASGLKGKFTDLAKEQLKGAAKKE